MKALLFGKNGQVGWELHRSLLPLCEVVAPERPDFDYADPESLRRMIREIGPDIVANCVAYTAVDRAESEAALAMRINADAVQILAEETRKRDALLIHYSTDYIFDGTKQDPYTEDDVPNPLNAYGRSKLAGDLAVQTSGCRHLILRSSWIYGARGRNFLLTMLRLASERPELAIVDDQTGAPTWSRMLAETTAFCVLRMLGAPDQGRSLSGIYNVSCSGHSSWFGFATAIFRIAKEKGVRNIPRLVPIRTSEYPMEAQRPLQSRLNNEKLLTRFGIRMPEWDRALQLCMEDLGIKDS